MLFNHVAKHQKKWAAFFLYVYLLQLSLPCAANSGSILRGIGPKMVFYHPVILRGLGEYAESTVNDAFEPAGYTPVSHKGINKSVRYHGPGPGQPEQKSFQSVNASNMVDLFSGDFSYNIPLMDVGGYPVNIHYRSGITMDQDASWVGLGWNIQPGSISRSMRGLPDDFNGDPVVKKEYTKPYWTAGINLDFDPEVIGLPLGLNLDAAGIFYNNYRGIGFEAGASINISLTSSKGAMGSLNSGLGVNLTNNSQNGFSIEPSFGLKRYVTEDGIDGKQNGLSIGTSFSTRTGLKDIGFSLTSSKWFGDQGKNGRSSVGSGISGNLSFAHRSYTPRMDVPYTSQQYNLGIKLGGEIMVLHPLAGLNGYYSRQYIDDADIVITSPAYGYANLQYGASNPQSLLDFNREKELPAYTADPPTPHLAIPNYTYDIFSISGEGTGGMFRAYRGDIGSVRDPQMQSKSLSAGVSGDLGFGDVFHGGIDTRFSYTTTTTGGWVSANTLNYQTVFKSKDSTFENVYYRNPGEKTSNTQDYYDKVGDTRVITPVMASYDDPSLTPQMQSYVNLKKYGTPLLFDGNVLKKNRDKRTQVITTLTAWDASAAGLDRQISYLPVNQFTALDDCMGTTPTIKLNRYGITSYRKAHHYSEFTVLNGDGKRYVYGLPVYNIEQQEVSFSVNPSASNAAIGGNQADFSSTDTCKQNTKGKDNFYNREIVPAYATNFLLTGLLSADYVDRTGNGITDDDQGDAVKFTYSMLYGESNPYRWKTPFGKNKSSYQEGLRTDTSDDKASYIYGSKEIYYLNSIVSKTMIATFTLNDPAKGEVRKDGNAVKDEGGQIDPTHALRYLKQIDLYSKQEYQRYNQTGRLPKPIKTVHFVYSYTLCTGDSASISGAGKLTLDSIWFSYNGNEKGHQNPYVFKYNNNNPSFSTNSTDRWGNYKNQTNNPSGLSNAYYPYTLQDSIAGWDSTKAATAASAWNLDSIQLPSKGTIKVNYESDDYAYVQNKRATEMMQVVGFGSASTSTPSARMMPDILSDYQYVFIKVPKAAVNKADVLKKYLEGIDKIYFSYRVKMPDDIYGSGFERIAVYAQFDDWGVTTDKYTIWIHMKSAESGTPFVSPLEKAAIQFLRLNLPSKAYPGSDLKGEYGVTAICKSLIGFIFNFSELITKFPAKCRILGIAVLTDPNSSFARLDNPAQKKFGGGLRVKRITISDKFNQLTAGKQADAIYGQEYDYTTTQVINNQTVRISSGVAAWEPSIGNEENPFRTPIEYGMQISPLAPASSMYSENPLGEGYFPAPQVGYSKIRIHTINNKVISANGYEESEFYTTYDFPTMTEQTPLDTKKYKPSFLADLFKINAKSFLSQTQGFKVEINDMDGKPEATASYSEIDPYSPIEYTKYYYKTDNDSAVFKHLNNTVSVVDSASGTVNTGAQIGKDIEVMIDTREELTQTLGIDLEFNTDAFFLGIIPMDISMVWPFPQSETDRYRSAATMKLVQRYGILNKVLHYEKGSLITTENLLFDAETGDAVLTRTKNEFEDSVYQFTYPAHWAYSGMEPAYKNVGAVFTGLDFSKGQVNSNSSYPALLKYFESGDEILVKSIKPKIGSTPGSKTCGGEGTCNTFNYDVPNNKRLWAVDASKFQVHTGLSGMYFLDSLGNFFSSQYSGTPDTLLIVRSGKRNLASTPVGSVQSLASPMRLVNGKWKLVFDSLTRVVNTNAATFRDDWKVEDVKMKVTQTTTTRGQGTHTAYFFPQDVNGNFTISNDYDGSNRTLTGIPNPEFFESAQFDNGGGANDMGIYSYLKFNIPSTPQFPGDTNYLPSGAYLGYCWLNLFPHLNNHPLTTSHSEAAHNATTPNQGTSGTDFFISRVTDPAFNSINIPALSTASTATLQGILNGSVDATTAAFMPKSGKQNGYEMDISYLFYTMYQNPSQPKALRIAPAASTGTNSRYCFFAKDICASTGCSTAFYAPANDPGLPLGSLSGCGLKGGGSQCDVRPYIKISYSWCPSGSPTQECDSNYCYTTTSATSCISAITDSTVNPYMYGALGNWRMNRAYTYYDNRKEADPLSTTDIRNNGTIASFKSYWNFISGNKMTTNTDSTIWVWNTESTQFNKMGLELENRNALNIYSAAQYGYNQSLPVAVTQNALYREQAYDGFEDYKFRNATANCAGCVTKRHIDIDNVSLYLDTVNAHTGKYSLKVNAGTTLQAHSAVASPLDTAAKLIMQTDTFVASIYNIQPAGTGLHYDVYNYGAGGYTGDTYALDQYNDYTGGLEGPYPSGISPVRYDFPGGINPFGSAFPSTSKNYRIVWTGYYMDDQDRTSIYFKGDVANSLKMWVDKTIYLNRFSNDPLNTLSAQNWEALHSYRGRIYEVRIEHTTGNSPGKLSLNWLTPQLSVFDTVPRKYMYATYAAAAAALHPTNTNCVNFRGIKQQNLLVKDLAASAGSKMLISAWVLENQNCRCSTYQHASLSVSFRDASGNAISTSTPALPSGNIIEKWQRVETVVDVPPNAFYMDINMNNDNSDGKGTIVYFDDLRVHPFNANMKSFVYDDVNLRLMAELDENNYASFYEYDEDGSLVRVKKETEKGIKTIKETRNALVRDTN